MYGRYDSIQSGNCQAFPLKAREPMATDHFGSTTCRANPHRLWSKRWHNPRPYRMAVSDKTVGASLLVYHGFSDGPNRNRWLWINSLFSYHFGHGTLNYLSWIPGWHHGCGFTRYQWFWLIARCVVETASRNERCVAWWCSMAMLNNQMAIFTWLNDKKKFGPENRT